MCTSFSKHKRSYTSEELQVIIYFKILLHLLNSIANVIELDMFFQHVASDFAIKPKFSAL
jgi:hypothetical protein